MLAMISKMRAFNLHLILLALPAAAATLDTITLGDAPSEAAHQFSGSRSEEISGGLGESARRLLAPGKTDPFAWAGGTLKFTLAVDPTNQNYATAKFWGSDATHGMLLFFCGGKQIGYRHLGDIDYLDNCVGEPAFPGRFFYTTTPLPVELTRGKTNVTLEIRSYGSIWTYARDFKELQKPMTEPSRGIYRIYIHTEGGFMPPPDEKQGEAPKDPPASMVAGSETLDQIKSRVNHELDGRLGAKTPCSQMQLQLLARAYDIQWTHGYHNPAAIEQMVRGLDALFVAYRKNPGLAQAEPSTWNPDWFGLGVCGEVIALRQAELGRYFDAEMDDGRGGRISRRAAYVEMLVACRDWHRQHRRLYTNQTMLNDLNGIYRANCGVAALAPGQALGEAAARRYLYESVGLEPWRGGDFDDAADAGAGRRNWGVGTNYWQFTAKGLTRELGYVGSYGEVIDLLCDVYNATRPGRGQPGDEMIRRQLLKLCQARANFRYPSVDENGNRVMRLEQVVGWRDSHFPGYLTYAQRATRDASALEAAAITLDPQLVGEAQQMIADNQFFNSELEAMKDPAQPLRTTIGRLETPDEYALIQSQPPQSSRLPMTRGQPDFVFSDEQDGVLAVKNGDEILYASLYWRARYAVNSLARVHFTTPAVDHIAVVREETLFTPSGQFFTRPNWINYAFGNGGPKFPVEIDSALAGERLPMAAVPPDVHIKPGDENVYAGKADFYSLRYGNYLVGMNLTRDKTFELKTPPENSEARELVSQKVLKLGGPLKVAPRSTVVLYFGK
jgi:hypothetical protein